MRSRFLTPGSPRWWFPAGAEGKDRCRLISLPPPRAHSASTATLLILRAVIYTHTHSTCMRTHSHTHTLNLTQSHTRAHTHDTRAIPGSTSVKAKGSCVSSPILTFCSAGSDHRQEVRKHPVSSQEHQERDSEWEQWISVAALK